MSPTVEILEGRGRSYKIPQGKGYCEASTCNWGLVTERLNADPDVWRLIREARWMLRARRSARN